jgi:hypothetical protein
MKSPLARRVVGTRQAACDGGGQRRCDYERNELGVQRENRTDALGRPVLMSSATTR